MFAIVERALNDTSTQFHYFVKKMHGNWFGIYSRGGNRGGSTPLQYYDFQVCGEMIRHFEYVNRPFKFDHVVLTRSDIFWLQPHPPIAAADCAFVPVGNDFGGVNDRHIALGRRNDADALFELFGSIIHTTKPASLCMRPNHIANSEVMLGCILRTNGTTVCRSEVAVFTSCNPHDAQPARGGCTFDVHSGFYCRNEHELARALALREQL